MGQQCIFETISKYTKVRMIERRGATTWRKSEVSDWSFGIEHRTYENILSKSFMSVRHANRSPLIVQQVD